MNLSKHSPLSSRCNSQIFVSKKTAVGPSVPHIFSKAYKDPGWRDKIDCEYNALEKRKCWQRIPRQSHMRPVPYAWDFRIKPLNAKWPSSSRILAVAFAVTNRKHWWTSTAKNSTPQSHLMKLFKSSSPTPFHRILILGCAEINKACIYGKIFVPIIMKHSTGSSQKQAHPGYFCELIMSLYRAIQAGQIWGSLFSETIFNWGFRAPSIDNGSTSLKKL